MTRYTEGFSHFVTSMTAPVASGWSDLAGWDSHPLESAALSRRTPEAVVRRQRPNDANRRPASLVNRSRRGPKTTDAVACAISARITVCRAPAFRGRCRRVLLDDPLPMEMQFGEP